MNRRRVCAILLTTLAVLVTNPELLALIVTVQAMGVEITLLLLALQFRSMASFLPTTVWLSKGYLQSLLRLARSVLDLAIKGLFPREALRTSSWQLAIAALLLVRIGIGSLGDRRL